MHDASAACKIQRVMRVSYENRRQSADSHPSTPLIRLFYRGQNLVNSESVIKTRSRVGSEAQIVCHQPVDSCNVPGSYSLLETEVIRLRYRKLGVAVLAFTTCLHAQRRDVHHRGLFDRRGDAQIPFGSIDLP